MNNSYRNLLSIISLFPSLYLGVDIVCVDSGGIAIVEPILEPAMLEVEITRWTPGGSSSDLGKFDLEASCRAPVLINLTGLSKVGVLLLESIFS